MELFVAVASTRRNQIPEVFKESDGEIFCMRYEVDDEDGEIYGRQQIVSNAENFISNLKMNKVQAFVFNTIDPVLEKQLAENDIKLYPGRTGSAPAAASALVTK